MMRRCAGLNADEAWRQLLEECQDITSLQLAPDDYLAYRVDAVDLKNRLRDVETDRRHPVHAALLRIVVTPAATTQWHLRAGGGAVHSIKSGHGADIAPATWSSSRQTSFDITVDEMLAVRCVPERLRASPLRCRELRKLQKKL